MCRAFKRRKPPKFIPIAPPPSAPEIMDVIDEITGTQSIVVTGPDGKKRRVVQRLPRTPQEEAFYRQGEELMARAIKNIQDLDSGSWDNFSPFIQAFANLNEEQAQDLSKIADFGNIQQDIDNFRNMQTSLLEDQFRRQNNQLESDLARKGRSSGSYGQERRARNDYYQNLARQQNEINALQYGEDLANQRLGRNLTAYQARQQGRENRLREAETAYGLKQHQLEENIRQLGIGASLTGQDLARALSTRAPELANQTFAMQSADQLNRYNSEINRQNLNYANQLARYNMSPPTFGEFVGNIAANQLGTSLTAPRGQTPQSSGKGSMLSSAAKIFV